MGMSSLCCLQAIRSAGAVAARSAEGGGNWSRLAFVAAPSLTLPRKPGREPTERVAASYNSTRLGRNPASVLPPPVGAISSALRSALARASS